jgi:hypothetical protein
MTATHGLLQPRRQARSHRIGRTIPTMARLRQTLPVQRLRRLFRYAGEALSPGKPQLKELATAVRRFIVARRLRGSKAFIPLRVKLLESLAQRYELIVARQSERQFAVRESTIPRRTSPRLHSLLEHPPPPRRQAQLFFISGTGTRCSRVRRARSSSPGTRHSALSWLSVHQQ